ncbi:MAG TPA: HPF/RaiA family ribosome-associated protein [Kofleriaceae bacterium]|nr:HPF/RaiA family ribosome-associated protein [Kofleriaceae bacterium]
MASIMPIPLQVTFRDMASTPALDELIRGWVSKLEHVYDRIERCHVLVERPHLHHHQGPRVHVRITLAVPGPDIVVSHDHALDAAHESAHVAIRDAFQAARRQLEDHVRRQRMDVKTRVEPAHGRVAYLDAEAEWGYLDADGRRIYFHHNSVRDARPLALGDEVRFTEEPGREGPQATSVERVGEHGHHELPHRG